MSGTQARMRDQNKKKYVQTAHLFTDMGEGFYCTFIILDRQTVMLYKIQSESINLGYPLPLSKRNAKQ